MTPARSPLSPWRSAYRWLTTSSRGETPEVREALLLTLAEPRVLAIFSFAWTQLLAWSVLVVSASWIPLAWVVADILVFSVRLTLSYRHDRALFERRPPPREAMVATELVGFALVSVGIGASFTINEPGLSVLLAIVATGIVGYVTARLAAFPRMAGGVLAFVALTLGAGLASSSIQHVWMLAALTPGIAFGFQLLTLNNHRILVGSLRAQQENRRLSLHDPLTGLANRLHLYESLARLTRPAASRDPRRLAVLCLDLDGFKRVNDEHGHPSGDVLLRTVAERLRACAGPSDVVARLGGDEFVIVSPETGRTDALALGARIIDAIAAPYRLGDETAAVGASIGISLAPDHAADPQDLLDQADRALYAVKRSGKGRCLVYSDDALETAAA
jgi:diguanylate cyclase (GGDEF)-like protein